MRRSRAILVTVGLFLGLVGCDHATKRAAEVSLRGRDAVPVIAGAVDLRYAENPGVAFGLERVVPAPARGPLLLLVAAVALVVVARTWRRRAGEVSARTIGYACLAAGVVGNLIDRILRGYVVDFVHVHHWPVFNVADVCIVVGAGLMLLATRARTGRDGRSGLGRGGGLPGSGTLRG